MTSDIDSYIPWGLKIGVSKIAAAWPFWEMANNHPKLWFYGFFVAKNHAKMKNSGIFEILSVRWIQWCALLVSYPKMIFDQFLASGVKSET